MALAKKTATLKFRMFRALKIPDLLWRTKKEHPRKVTGALKKVKLIQTV